MKTGPSNENLQLLIRDLKILAAKEKVALWKRVAIDLEKPTRRRRIVNLSRISQYTKPDQIVIVPGKLLASGDLTHKVTVAAFAFSGSAKEKIAVAKGRAITIQELMKENMKGKGIQIIG